MVSYDNLLIGPPRLDANGKPITVIEDGVPIVQRLPGLVDVDASEGEAVGLARKSRLVEILAGQGLMASAEAVATHPTPGGTAPDHSKMLNLAEKRLVAEWIDLGGKYFNDPFDPSGNVRVVAALNESSYIAQVHPILKASCGPNCHQPVGSGGTSFSENRFVLTGDPEGDYNVTLTMISDACTPASNFLLSRPSTIPHPAGATTQTKAVLPVGSPNYAVISAWILSGCAQ